MSQFKVRWFFQYIEFDKAVNGRSGLNHRYAGRTSRRKQSRWPPPLGVLRKHTCRTSVQAHTCPSKNVRSLVSSFFTSPHGLVGSYDPFTNEQLAWLQATFGPPRPPGTSTCRRPNRAAELCWGGLCCLLRDIDGRAEDAASAQSAGK